MSFESALRTRLLADPFVGPMVGPRVHWRRRPQNGALPAIVLTIVADPRPQHLDGFHSLRATRVQAECYAWSDEEARELRDAVIPVLAAKADAEDTRFDTGVINNTMDRGEDTSAGFVDCQLIDASLWHGSKETT